MNVLAARDGIVAVAKFVGMDLGKFLKFKPWGAVKFAKGANGALAAFGLVMEAWDSWEEHKRQDAFQHAIKDMISNFEKQRSELLGIINSDEFKEKFFPDYIALSNNIGDLEHSLNESKERQQLFKAWRATAENINSEFNELGR